MSMSSKRKRRIILNLFEDDPIHVSRKQVDADDWMHILEFVETWKGEVLGRDLLRDLLRSIEVDPNDEEKRIIAFRTPTFLREMIPLVDANYLIPTTTTTTAPRQQQQQQQRLPDLSTLDQLKVLELEGKGNFPIMKGLENLYNLQELKISFMCYGQLCTFSNEISRLSKLKKLVLGCSNLVSCLGPSLADLIAPTLQELYIQWNLQYSAMDYNKDNHDLLLSSSWKFWNLKVLDLGDPRFYQQNQSNQTVQLQLLCGLLSNCTKLEKVRMDMRDLIDLLTLEQSKEDNNNNTDNNTDDHDHGEKKVQNYSWTSKLHDVTIDFGFVDVEYNEEIVASALQKIAQYMKSVRRLRLRFYYSNNSNVVDENRHHGTLVLPLSILHPLSSTLEEFEVSDSSVRTAINPLTHTHNIRGTTTINMNTNIPFLDVRLQDIRHLSKLQIVKFESCRLLEGIVQPSQDFSEILTNVEAEAAATATESTTKTDIPTKTIIPERNTTAAVPSVSTDSNNNSQRQRQNVPILRRLEFIRCLGFFRNEPMNSMTNEGDDGNDSSSSSLLSSSRAMEGKQTACDFCESCLDLSELRVFRLAQCNSELGNEEVSILCKKILSKCSQLEILDLSDGNIETVTTTTTSGGGNSSSSSSSNNHHHSIDLLSCPLQKLRVLDFSRNSMVCPERDDDDKEIEEGGNSNGIIIDKTTMMISSRTRNNINIQSLCSLVETFPLLGHTGKFNILFLGKLGERYTRLHDYYRLVHHLCLNRARTRITMGQNVPIGLWPIALQKSQRAFDDYQGYELWGKNRKEEPDSIFNLLRERGAIDIFTSQKSRSERSI